MNKFARFKVLLILISGSIFAAINPAPCSTLPCLVPGQMTELSNIRVEQQNGKLMTFMLDPKTGKYTDDVLRGKQIIEQWFQP